MGLIVEQPKIKQIIILCHYYISRFLCIYYVNDNFEHFPHQIRLLFWGEM